MRAIGILLDYISRSVRTGSCREKVLGGSYVETFPIVLVMDGMVMLFAFRVQLLWRQLSDSCVAH